MRSTQLAGALVAAAALAVPTAAAAHPSVYTSAAQVVEDESTPAVLTPQTRYVVANHGFTYVLRESNAGTDGDHRGVFDYKSLPGAYRATLADWDALRAAGATDAQAHATCRVPALESEAAIRAWQGEDPFYAYVPFQRASAGLEDDPATWIPVVRARTGVDLAALATAAEAEAACEALPGAGADAYVPADATQSTNEAFNSGLIEHTTEPLAAEIAGLTSAATALRGLLDAARAELAALTAATAPMTVALPTASLTGRAFLRDGTTAAITGPAGASVAVKLALSESRARRLGLTSTALARGRATLGADGSARVALRARRSPRKALRGLRRTTGFTVTALAGGRIATASGTLTR